MSSDAAVFLYFYDTRNLRRGEDGSTKAGKLNGQGNQPAAPRPS